MPIITTKYALHHEISGAWKEIGNSLWFARSRAIDGWELYEYSLFLGWLKVEPAKFYRTRKRVAAAGGYL